MMFRLDRAMVREHLGLARMCFALAWLQRAFDIQDRAHWMNANISPGDERSRAWDDDPECADDRECWDPPWRLADRLGEPWRLARGGGA